MTTPVNDCPSAVALKAYASGALDRSAHAVIDEHLDSCVTCQGELETLDELPGTLFYGLRGQPPAPTAPDPLLDELQARAMDLAATAPAPNCPTQSGPLLAEEVAAVTSYQAQEIHAGRGDGLVLGHYLLQCPIGAGGMGRVFQAYHRRMKRVVALKIMAPELLRSSAARARFQREIEAVARLRSPYIVTAYDAGEDHGRDYLVMEYAAGPTLAELVKQQGPLPVERALTYVLHAARGLACAHEAGIIHRDVKPANLLLTTDGNPASEVVKVLDLGLARLQAPGDASPGSGLTGSQVVAGTAAFMAPEQALHSGQADARADVYSLGCTLCYLLAGKPPYPGETAMEILFAHREQPIPSLAAPRPDCPAAVDALFQRMAAKRKEDRPDLPAVIASLESLLGAPARQEGGRAQQHAAAARRRRMLAGMLSAAGVLAACLLIAWAVQRTGDPGGDPATEAAAPTRSLGTPAIDLVAIPAGDFWMGAADDDADASGDEKPRHRVAITLPFQLAKFEITQGQYEEVMGGNPSAFSARGQFRRRVGGADTRNHPVESLSWLDAVRFCNRLSERHGLPPYYRIDGAGVAVRGGDGYRLPTEAEWEYASRAGGKGRWHFGDRADDLSAHAWHAANSGDFTHPVGQKAPNAFGLHDMVGNVPEWCWDRYDPAYYKLSPASDPAGSGHGATRVYRGGGWNSTANRTRAAARHTLAPTYGMLTHVGLRVARNAP